MLFPRRPNQRLHPQSLPLVKGGVATLQGFRGVPWAACACGERLVSAEEAEALRPRAKQLQQGDL